VRNYELEELRRRIKELENRRLGDVEVESESKDEIKEERDVEEGHPTICVIYFLRDKGSARDQGRSFML
jgi:hypothetical protein